MRDHTPRDTRHPHLEYLALQLRCAFEDGMSATARHGKSHSTAALWDKDSQTIIQGALRFLNHVAPQLNPAERALRMIAEAQSLGADDDALCDDLTDQAESAIRGGVFDDNTAGDEYGSSYTATLKSWTWDGVKMGRDAALLFPGAELVERIETERGDDYADEMASAAADGARDARMDGEAA